MRKRTVFSLFVVCCVLWAVIVDNVVLPSSGQLVKEEAHFTRYTFKRISHPTREEPFKDELVIHAVVEGYKELLYYIDNRPGFEARLNQIEAATPVELYYANRFPKIWKRKLYEMRINDQLIVGFSPVQLEAMQKRVWILTGGMGVIYLVLMLFGAIVLRPRKRKRVKVE